MLSTTFFSTAIAIGSPARAQEATPPPTAPQDNQESQAATDSIVVTGTRIARTELTSTAPVTVTTAEQILATGAGNINDVLSQLPSVGQGVSRANSNFASFGNGSSLVNLRNLGVQRTLVLINGRRSLGVLGSSSVDVNNIPTELIDRVEVITGGASAVYGSEAIAGVVNFVLKNNFDGVAVRSQATLSDKGDAARQFVSLTAGQNFGDGRGNISANVTYEKDHGLRSRDRAFSAHDNPNRSSFAQQGLFSVDPTGLFATNGKTFTFDSANQVKPYQGANIDGYDRNQQRLLSVPVERIIGTILGHYDFSDALKMYVEGQYARTKSNASLEALAVGNTGPGPVTNFDGSPYAGIPITSPYVPAAIRAAAIANGVNVIQFRRRSVDIFSRSNNDKRDYYRGVVGFKGDIGSNWSYDVYFEHSAYRDHTSTQQILASNYGAALSNQLNASGTVVCSDPGARAAGCVPINIFGFNTVTPQAALWLQTDPGPQFGGIKAGQRVTYDYMERDRQDLVSASVTGKLFHLWGDPVSIAAGGEYRYERSSTVFDPYTQAGLSEGNQLSNTIGHYNVKEGYVEVVAPIVERRPGFHYLGIEAAARYGDYSTIGGVWSYKFGGDYAPVPDLRFRAIYAVATRAPNIGELFAATSQTFPGINDPCDQNGGNGDLKAGQSPSSLPPLSAKCAALPGVARTVAQRGAFYYTTAEIQSVDGLLGGNPALKAERAKSITAGVVFTPTFFHNFSLTADYYHITVNNAVGIIGQQISVDQCQSTGNPIFCSNVIRGPNSGIITRVNAINLNTGSITVAGIDVEARYGSRLGLLGQDGRISVDVMWNHRFKQENVPFPGGDVQNELGQANCYVCGRLGSGFHDRANGTVTVHSGPLTFVYNLNYQGPLVDNLGGAATRIPAYLYHSSQIRLGIMNRFEVYFGVNNLFDKQPPVFSDTNPVTVPGTQTVPDTYDVYGRMLYAGVTFHF